MASEAKTEEKMAHRAIVLGWYAFVIGSLMNLVQSFLRYTSWPYVNDTVRDFGATLGASGTILLLIGALLWALDAAERSLSGENGQNDHTDQKN